MTKLKLRCSPITNKIYAGKLLKSGSWGQVKHDVTEDAVGSVAEHLLRADEKLQFSYEGKTYELKVVEVVDYISNIPSL